MHHWSVILYEPSPTFTSDKNHHAHSVHRRHNKGIRQDSHYLPSKTRYGLSFFELQLIFLSLTGNPRYFIMYGRHMSLMVGYLSGVGNVCYHYPKVSKCILSHNCYMCKVTIGIGYVWDNLERYSKPNLAHVTLFHFWLRVG